MAEKFNAKKYLSMDKKDKEKYKEENESFYLDRIIEIAEKLDIKVSLVTGKSRSIEDKNGYQIGQKIFGTYDKHDDIDSYFKAIKKSEKYEKFIKKSKKN